MPPSPTGQGALLAHQAGRHTATRRPFAHPAAAAARTLILSTRHRSAEPCDALLRRTPLTGPVRGTIQERHCPGRSGGHSESGRLPAMFSRGRRPDGRPRRHPASSGDVSNFAPVSSSPSSTSTKACAAAFGACPRCAALQVMWRSHLSCGAVRRGCVPGVGAQAGVQKQALCLFFIYQDLPGLPMALRVSGRLTVLPTSYRGARCLFLAPGGRPGPAPRGLGTRVGQAR